MVGFLKMRIYWFMEDKFLKLKSRQLKVYNMYFKISFIKHLKDNHITVISKKISI